MNLMKLGRVTFAVSEACGKASRLLTIGTAITLFVGMTTAMISTVCGLRLQKNSNNNRFNERKNGVN